MTQQTRAERLGRSDATGSAHAIVMRANTCCYDDATSSKNARHFAPQLPRVVQSKHGTSDKWQLSGARQGEWGAERRRRDSALPFECGDGVARRNEGATREHAHCGSKVTAGVTARKLARQGGRCSVWTTCCTSRTYGAQRESCRRRRQESKTRGRSSDRRSDLCLRPSRLRAARVYSLWHADPSSATLHWYTGDC